MHAIIAPRLRERLLSTGLSQSELARRARLTQGTIGGLLSGKARSSAHLHLIARELGTTPAYLTGETDDPDSDAPNAPALTHREEEWLELIRNLQPKDQDALMQLARTIANSAQTPALNDRAPDYRSEEHR